MIDERYVEIFKLVKAYPNPFGDDVNVIDGFELIVPKGEVVAVIGHSGCGKSTVLNMIAGLNPVTSGGIIVANKEVSGPGPDRAVVFQSPCLLPWMTALGNVALGLKTVYPNASRRERHEIAEYCLEMVGLGDSLDKHPRELSGGMQQRVGVARALALKPVVLLLDEPFGRLDSLTRMELQDTVLGILDREKITTIIITHEVDEAIYMSDRVCMMTNGPGAKVGDLLKIDFPRPRNRVEMLEHPKFYEYRQRLLQFLDNCELEKEKLARERTESCREPVAAGGSEK